MPDSQPTQKETAQKYSGNLGYFRKAHYFRGMRGVCFAIAVLGSLGAVIAFHFWGRQEIFSTGPISENHARFATNCRVCHPSAESDLLGAFDGRRPAPDEDLIKTRLPEATAKILAPTSISLMDRACIQCHPTKGLHLPQAEGLAMRAVSTELNVVHATACASCHREHVGHGRMPATDSARCVTCHDNLEELRRARRSLKLDHQPVAATGENRSLGDGLVRFLTPPRPIAALQPFDSYAGPHPPFDYEGMKDPTVLRFNHERHQPEKHSDIPKVNGRELDCASCHQPGPGGVLMQPVRYQQHCVTCHSLQIQPSLPNLHIPHGDPEKVRYFLASLDVSFQYALRAEGVTDSGQLSKRLAEEQDALRRNGLTSLDLLEKRVFFQGDLRETTDRRPRAASTRKFLTECAKCHEVKEGNVSHAPPVTRPNIAERWVQRATFTHLPHGHMSCLDCHGAARTSKDTSDILLPPKVYCAGCHRPADPVADAEAGPLPQATRTADTQLRTGGVKADCQSCHGFHSPPTATKIVSDESSAPVRPGGGK